ncbi:acyl-CoA thioesterase [Pseudolysobacter antarcticus]|uniref:Acyl-CoA thioesterase n=1 Tax=Pseudolysobacter antarcticus TaxID=2511995 RepID=A0A411HPA3_9GAMM|nr:acyl-CoA thioesterase [Pseudolysobacter antarcticus]QBB72317.1 acyl-CoA thioesterase [Pseudolysobacter antarcticus]
MPVSEAAVLTEVRLLEMVFPDQTNHYGTLFGGHALALMDKAAFIAASRYSRRTVVTARSEQIDFRSPVRQGQLIELIGGVVATGRSSMTVAVDLYAEDLLSGERQLCTRGHFVMIALDANHKPVAVPLLATVVAGDDAMESRSMEADH